MKQLRSRASDDETPPEPDAPELHLASPDAPPPPRDWRALALANWRMLAAGAFLALGVLLLILAWVGTAYTDILYRQVPYIVSGGLMGLGLIFVAGTLAVSAAAERQTRAIRHEMRLLVEALASGTAASSRVSGDAPVLVLEGGRSFHVGGCPIVEGKDGVSQTTAARAAGGGLTACKLCAAD